ncbi:MAG: hypothetical protein KGJ23_10525 [Euryarchaeota archaeon]|nr:hypothetical protein [Euryarchaeota archaeon]MDE1837040.1 hypothetical protein [Euryarchaeota archaeon]MDE2045698.1 hypothetical protein [Thermoplasmata archaeon]
MSRSRRELFMGHAGRGVDFDYNLDRPMSTERIEDLRDSYRRCDSYLSVSPGRPEHETEAKMAKLMLMGAGYTQEELAQVDLLNLDMPTLQTLPRRKQAPAPTQPRQRLVTTEELASYLDHGWTVVTTIGVDRIVITPPIA